MKRIPQGFPKKVFLFNFIQLQTVKYCTLATRIQVFFKDFFLLLLIPLAIMGLISFRDIQLVLINKRTTNNQSFKHELLLQFSLKGVPHMIPASQMSAVSSSLFKSRTNLCKIIIIMIKYMLKYDYSLHISVFQMFSCSINHVCKLGRLCIATIILCGYVL